MAMYSTKSFNKIGKTSHKSGPNAVSMVGKVTNLNDYKTTNIPHNLFIQVQDTWEVDVKCK